MGASSLKRLGLSEKDIVSVISKHPGWTKAEIGRFVWDTYNLKNSSYMLSTVVSYISKSVNSISNKGTIYSKTSHNRRMWYVEPQHKGFISTIKRLFRIG